MGAPDTYPGDAQFERLARGLATNAANNTLSFDWAGRRGMSRSQLCGDIVAQHFGVKNPGMDLTNAEWLGAGGTASALTRACIAAMNQPNMCRVHVYNWNDWSGTHHGSWHAPNKIYHDEARWSMATTGAQARLGHPQVRHQPVVWPNRPAASQNGWNESHRDEAFVWGWDPKENGNEQGLIATHIGFPFSDGTVRYIIWLTYKSAFLEGINTGLTVTRQLYSQEVTLSGDARAHERQLGAAPRITRTGRPKTSTEIPSQNSGFGQWLAV